MNFGLDEADLFPGLAGNALTTIVSITRAWLSVKDVAWINFSPVLLGPAGGRSPRVELLMVIVRSGGS